MKRVVFYYVVFVFFMILTPPVVRAQSDASVREYQKEYTTYPFSDPDPVANNGKIYPYFRYDGFTDKPVKKSWKVVELENDYIRVQIMPEIGGKIWTAVEKKTGTPFLYDNEVVKFRDIAMRGPWTSGGIEANFGIIGHTPAVATPVDYLVRKNGDGSVSCFISNLDLLTRSKWIMEIRLPKDKAYFITQVNWHNASDLTQPYYSWMNLAVKVTDSLHFIDPGTHYIGHDGKSAGWPLDPENGKDLSVYGQNNFGGSKSYHIVGTYSKYYGAHWPEENKGMIHYAEREDKPGRKVFLWALSDQGKIWEKLLTDNSGQYAEIQSGRLFNQNMFSSSYTPFKQRDFLPFQTDSWREYWYPFSATGGVGIADLNGVMNVRIQKDTLTVFISPVSKVADDLIVYDEGGKMISSQKLQLTPLQPDSCAIVLGKAQKVGRIAFHGSEIIVNDKNYKDLQRPVDPYPGFDWASAYGLYLLGRDAAHQRMYGPALNYIRQSLQKDPAYLPSLSQMAQLQYQRMNYDSAFYFAKLALSIDTYDPEANFYYGLSAKKQKKEFDALDGFEIAGMSVSFRSAAFTEMSKIYLAGGVFDKAYWFAARSLETNRENITALRLQTVAARLLHRSGDESAAKQALLGIDPLSHFVAFENFLKSGADSDKKIFQDAIRSELGVETYLELALWYHAVNRDEESKILLQLAPQSNGVQYWQAFLNRGQDGWKPLLQNADNGSPLMVFPFREETAQVMDWAIKHTDDWKPRYYLALIESFRGHREVASALLNDVRSDVKFAPFYITRYQLRQSSGKELQSDDLRKAISLSPGEWRYKKEIAEYYLKNENYGDALAAIEPYSKAHPENFITGMLYARTLLYNGRLTTAEQVLSKINVLPFEGATSGHRLYREIKLLLALDALKKRAYATALKKVKEARLWPENLGEGAPYPDMINTEVEDGIENLIREAQKNKKIEIDYDYYAKRIKETGIPPAD